MSTQHLTSTHHLTSGHHLTSTAPPAVELRPRRPRTPSWDHTASAADLVRAVGAGDQQAWTELVRRYERLVCHVARHHGLGPAECADVCQATWVRLLGAAAGLHEPHRIAAWLVTTARRESLRLLTGAARRREAPGGLVPAEHHAARTAPGSVEAPVLRVEQDRIVRDAVDRLPGRAGAVLRLLMDDEGLSYAEVARRVGIAPGSVGPLRNRAIRRLRDDQRLSPTALAS